MVAVTIRRLTRALAGLDPGDRALLDLSLRRALPDDDIAQVLHTEPDEVAERRDTTLESLERELGLDTREAQDELRATLPDLPDSAWSNGQAARA